MTSPIEQHFTVPFTPGLQRELLLRTADMPGADFRVLTFFVTEVPMGQTVRVVGKDVAGAVKLNPGSVSKSLQRLVKAGYLEVSYHVGHVTFYRVGKQVIDLAMSAHAEADGAEHEEGGQQLAPVRRLPARLFGSTTE